MKFFVSLLILLVLCGVSSGHPPPQWPPPSYAMDRQWQNIMDYGAKGDGTTDDRAAIQAAFDACPDSGGTVFVPHSDSGFLITNTLRQPSYVRLLGVGWGSRIQMHPDSSRCILANADTTNGDTGIVVENIYFDGAKNYTLFSDRDSADCISFINVHRSSVKGCWVTRTDADGIAFRRGTDNKILNNTLWELGEDGITVAGLGSGSNIVSGNHVAGRDTSYEVGGLIPSGILCKSSEAIITDNVVVDCGAAVDINNESGDTLRNITVTENLFLNSWQTTVSVADGFLLTISDNDFYDCASEGVFLWAVSPPSYSVTISGNDFYGQGGIAIRAQSGDNHTVSQNKIIGSDTTAIVVSGDHVTVTTNTIDTVSAGYGIHLQSSRYSSVSINIISNVNNRGIYSEGGSGGEYTTFTGNTVSLCGGPGIYLLSTDFSTLSANISIDNDSAGIWLQGSYNNEVIGNVCTSPVDSQEYGVVLSGSSKNYVSNNQLGGNATDTGIVGFGSNQVYANREDTLAVGTNIDFLGRIVLENIDNTARIDIRGLAANLRLNATTGQPFIEFQLDTVTIWRLQTDSTSQDFNFRANSVNRIAVTTGGAITFNEAYTFPTADGTGNYVLTTDGAGTVAWQPGGAGGGTSDSIGVDTDGNGTVDNYIYPSFLKKGSNITFTVTGDTLTVAGPAGSGTADSLGIDTDGDGTVDNYLYSTVAGAFHLKKGSNITLTVAGDTVTVASTGAGVWALVGDADTVTLVGTSDTLMTLADTGAYTSIETENVSGFTFLDVVKFQQYVELDDGSGNSPYLTFLDENDDYFQILRHQSGYAQIRDNSGYIRLQTRGDYTDYIVFDTFAADVPMIGTAGACDLVITASSGEISLDDDNLTTTGTLDAGATSVTGNIAVTGTVDTVDVAALGATVPKITDDTTDFKTAYGWGDHSGENYLDNDDPDVDTLGWNKGRDSGLVAWNWGDHSAQGYVNSLPEVFGYFSRRYFDTLSDQANGWYGDTIICNYSDSTDLTVFDTDDLTEGSSNLYDQALPDSSEWSEAYDSSQVGYLNPADANVDTAHWNAAWVWGDHSGEGYITNSKFSDSSITLLNATAWRLFYSNATTTAIQELALGSDGTYLKSNGASSAPTWATPGGAGLDTTEVLDILRDSISGDGTVGAGGVLNIVHADSTGAVYSADVVMDTLSAPTYSTLEEWFDVSQSAMIISGGSITQDASDSTVIDIAAGTGIIKKTDSDIGENKFFDFSSGNDIAVANNTELLVYVDYNGGSPIFATTAAASVTFTNQVVLGRVYRVGNHMHLTQGGQNFTNFMVKNSYRIYELYDLHRGSGLVTSEGADASNDIDVSSGAFYLANNRQTLSAVASFTDDIELWYGNGSGGFTAYDTTALNDISYDDGDGTRAALLANRYNIFWVFMETDGELIALYDSVTQVGGYSLGAAEAKTVVTTLPQHVPSSAILVAKIIVQEDAGILSIEYPWAITFAGALTADHGSLAGLGDDDHTQYLKESDTNAYSVTVLLSADTAMGESLGGYLTGNESITLSGDATGSGATAITVTVVDDLHNHVYSNIDPTTSANWIGRVSDETGTGKWVFATSPTFTTSIIMGAATLSEAELEILDGATPTTTEFNYVAGVTSAIQTQLDAKEVQLDNEAGLYAVLSDVTDFVQPGEVPALIGPFIDTTTLDTIENAHFAVYATSLAGDLNSTNNLEVRGDLLVTGNINHLNFQQDLDLSTAFCAVPGDSIAPLPIEVVEDIPDSRRDSIRNEGMALHPSNIYVPGGWPASNPHSYWMAFNPWPDGYVDVVSVDNENPHIACSDDGISWTSHVGSGSDSITNPIYTKDDIDGCTHLADQELFFDAEGDLWCGFRATLTGDTQHIYVTSSSDGISWGNETSIISDPGLKALMSPSIILDTMGTYQMWTVDGDFDPNKITRYGSVAPDSGWEQVGLAYDLGAERPTGLDIWHIEVIQYSVDVLLGLFYFCDSGALGTGGTNGGLYLAKSTDRGATWDVDDDPLLIERPSGWGDHYVYRMSGHWLRKATGELQLVIYYSARQVGGDTPWWIGKPVYMTLKAIDTLDYTFNLNNPDALYANDAEISIDPRTSAAITITRIDITLDADPTTELTFSLKYADAFIGFANAVVIDDTATVAGVTTVTGGFGDPNVPANKCIYWLFDADPDDAITQASVKIHYTVDR